ncbi:MAG TPA: hypothetical protein VFF96_01760 [Pseudoxanthomonas sp.]|nr:hypothetical protein [Pseudoxanthomonas sp.]
MPSKSLHLLPALGASGAVLGLALLASLAGSGQGRTVEAEIGADLTGTEAVRTDDTAPRRHRRHSLTMPYFSFAQSLRPRN